MSAEYENAKLIALGLEADSTTIAPQGDDIWNISLGGFGGGLSAQMPFQMFEKGFEPPEELTMHRSALMLHDDEYAADKEHAKECVEVLEKYLENSDAGALKDMLSTDPPEMWLSLIFLNGDKLREELVPAIRGSSPECREFLATALDGALGRMVDFKDLFEALKECCE